MKTLILNDSPSDIKKGAKIIREGGLVVFPTETVYGLGADATNETAVASVFRAKGRPSDNPLIVHIASVSDINKYGRDIPDMAFALFEKFAPGPLTVVVKRSRQVSGRVSAGLDTVALRIPAHPVARELIIEAGVPVCAPSANISGRPSPTSFDTAFKDMDGKAVAVIDGGDCAIGLESTVVGFDGGKVVILRPGMISAEMIKDECGFDTVFDTETKERVSSPGVKYAHYRPDAEIFMSEFIDVDKIRRKFGNQKVGIIGMGIESNDKDIIIADFATLEDYARGFYKTLIEFERMGVGVIVAGTVDEKGIGVAIMNRLRKASAENTLDY
jgi:L-threonylcarbamoyladenylate synthase